MPSIVKMPALSPTMEKGKIVEWMKQEGDKVVSGDILVTIETDKAVMEMETVDEGVLASIMYPNGAEDVTVGEAIAYLLEDGESLEDIKALQEIKTARDPEPKQPPEAPSVATREEENKSVDDGDRVFATPLARKIASQLGVDLACIKGTGPRGRIIRRDVEAYDGQSEKALKGTLQPMSNMRKVIGQRLLESKVTVPHFYLNIDVCMDAANAVRLSLKNKRKAITLHHMIMRAVALALQDCPDLNVSKDGDNIRYFEHSDVSFALSMPSGLITPVVLKAEEKGLLDIAQEVRTLSAKGKEGKLKPHEFIGGSICVSNLGMYGVKSFSAIINPPQASILAVGAVHKELTMVEGQVCERSVMSCTLSVDHRVADGVSAALFLQSFKEYIEAPILLSI